jgi:cysteine-rich repeat protein
MSNRIISVSFFIFFFFAFFSFGPNVFANNLSISNVSLEDRNSTNDTIVIEFDISWDNSWRSSTNHDAVWLVVKVDTGAGYLVHGLLETAGVNPSGTSPGTNQDLEIWIPSDQLYYSGSNPASTDTGQFGAMIRRSSSGSGTVSSRNVRLVLDYGASSDFHPTVTISDTASISVKVIGIEMVYIPEGPFRAGDTSATARFQQGSGDTDPWYISSDDAISVTNAASDGFYYTSTGSGTQESSTGSTFTIEAEFPVGYSAFYCMKYELTEAQYVEFWNNITASGQTKRDITGSPKSSDGIVVRNTVSMSGGVGTTLREDRAANYVSLMDLFAYLDWMALRPMSELEFEKAARGPLSAVSGEYAWGTTNITAGVTFSGSPESGNVIFSTAGANAVYNSTTFSQGDDFLGSTSAQGPVRVGIFATSSSDREESGAGYYGAMELSGNLMERPISVGNTTGRLFWPIHGDGLLSSETVPTDMVGNARQLGWPGTMHDGGNTGVTVATGTGTRGGGWNSTSGGLSISDRSDATTARTARLNRAGGRGVRGVDAYPEIDSCGDGSTTYPEQCDDGNNTDEDGCSAYCECELNSTDPDCPSIGP